MDNVDLVAVCDEIGGKYGIPVVNKRISVSPVAVVGGPFGPRDMVRICQALDEAAREAGVDFLGGFSALVEKGFANGDRALIEAMPAYLQLQNAKLADPALRDQARADRVRSVVGLK
jgi:uncharacterized protein (UPF0210 family)